MTHYAEPNYIQYDVWFDKNIDPCELEYEKEKKFSDSVHEKFYKMSNHNLIVGGSESISGLNISDRCSGDFCPLTEEELKQI